MNARIRAGELLGGRLRLRRRGVAGVAATVAVAVGLVGVGRVRAVVAVVADAVGVGVARLRGIVREAVGVVAGAVTVGVEVAGGEVGRHVERGVAPAGHGAGAGADAAGVARAADDRGERDRG